MPIEAEMTASVEAIGAIPVAAGIAMPVASTPSPPKLNGVGKFLLAVNAVLMGSVCWLLAVLAVKTHAAHFEGVTRNSYDDLAKRAAVPFVINERLRLDNLPEEPFRRDVMNALISTAKENPTLLAALDLVLSRRVLRRLGVPLVPALYEATEHEYNRTALEILVNDTTDNGTQLRPPGFVVRSSQVDRQIQADRKYPFTQGDLLVTNRTWTMENYTAAHFADAVEEQLHRPFDKFGPFPLAAAPKGVIVEEIYAPASDLPNSGMGTIGWPVALHAVILFGNSYIFQVRDLSGNVCYWAMRNGTSSVNIAKTGVLEEFKFLEVKVQAALPDIVFHSERIANVLGAPFLSTRWLIGGFIGARLHLVRYFWVDSLEQEWDDRVVADLAAGLEKREKQKSYSVPSVDCMLAIGCQLNDTKDPASVWCGPAPKHTSSLHGGLSDNEL
eukprot:gnl/TRDRNA2_/TRDRNA2_39696_c0_seq1.p1 gnl/TRDRNA2_/TRDRNA2_39696_c0~~gnl/TRDRNA2_/TRDRNA2_39696_c0_seq1.p1  ORF type:complete len:443 (-),score=69.43 gnl/TRDRNA2_/TRDRNA2_39696_c0_seq1:107-1435(-)